MCKPTCTVDMKTRNDYKLIQINFVGGKHKRKNFRTLMWPEILTFITVINFIRFKLSVCWYGYVVMSMFGIDDHRNQQHNTYMYGEMGLHFWKVMSKILAQLIMSWISKINHFRFGKFFSFFDFDFHSRTVAILCAR